MPGGSSRQVLRQLNTLFHCGVSGPLSDEELLEQFVSGSDDAAEAAFTALVDRHGGMVLGVCRRVLGDRHAAEDAFQATFFVLARKAPTISRREQLASWLHGVARRAAMDARARATRQHAKEKRLGNMAPVERTDEIQTSELRSILDEELARLPERHRAAIVLCELEGLSRHEAAGRLGVSEGTLSSRLSRAKTRLRDRLTRRGLDLSTAALTSTLAQDAQALSIPPSLVDSTIRGATLVATGSSLAGVASTSVITLTEGVLKAMLLSKLKFAFLGLVSVALVTTGAGVVAQDRPSDEDRLKSVERKLDRLLEAIGGSSRHAPAADRAGSDTKPAAPAPAPPLAPTAPVPALPRIASVLPPPQQPGAPQAHLPTPSALPPTPALAAAAPDQALPPAAPQPAQLAPSISLAGRVDVLEQRLANLERRLADFERRLSRTSSGLPSDGSAPVAPAHLLTPVDTQRLDVPFPTTPTTTTPAAVPSPDAPPPPPTPVPLAAPPAEAASPPSDAPAAESAPPSASPVGEPVADRAPESPRDTPPQPN
jgi:RNA polymerase sigma factor (sigma-70 family)